MKVLVVVLRGLQTPSKPFSNLLPGLHNSEIHVVHISNQRNINTVFSMTKHPPYAVENTLDNTLHSSDKELSWRVSLTSLFVLDGNCLTAAVWCSEGMSLLLISVKQPHCTPFTAITTLLNHNLILCKINATKYYLKQNTI